MLILVLDLTFSKMLLIFLPPGNVIIDRVTIINQPVFGVAGNSIFTKYGANIQVTNSKFIHAINYNSTAFCHFPQSLTLWLYYPQGVRFINNYVETV